MAKKGGFPGFPGGNMSAMIKQAQKMQKEMERAQQEAAEKEVEASVGGGAVIVKANGAKQVLSIKINPDVLDPEDAETAEDLILTAVNQALKAADDMMNNSMGKVTGSMNIPGLF